MYVWRCRLCLSYFSQCYGKAPTQQKQPKEGSYVRAQFERALYHDKEGVVGKAALAMAGVWGNWPHCVPVRRQRSKC